MKQITLAILVLVFYSSLVVQAQNIAITDDDSYSADNSAMLDVKSTTKGVLVPRVTTIQRNLINSPAKGLLVFDTDINAFFFFNGTIWVDLSTSLDSPWLANSSGIYIADTTLNMGVGTTSADGKFEVRGDGNGGSGELLFAVRNSNGDTVFAVYDGGVRIYVDESSKGVRGGFAVGGYGGAKGTTEYLRVTPDSVRIYVNESTEKGVRGGFAVGGYGGAKGEVNELLRVTPDSVRIYVNESEEKGVRGGFAVGGYGGAKSIGNEYLRVTPDSVRVYVDESAKGVRGGFAVGGYGGAKGTTSSYMQIDKENYFIGENSGINIETGQYNSTLGYSSGMGLTNGSGNVFLGYKSGLLTSDGYDNVFIGNEAGLNNKSGFENVVIGSVAGHSIDSAYKNIIIGKFAGEKLVGGLANVFIGVNAGNSTTQATGNIFIGDDAGIKNDIGANNLFMGSGSGFGNVDGMGNIFLGTRSGYNNTSGSRNIYIGEDAGNSSDTASYNTFLGFGAGFKNKGNGNVFIGEEAGFNTEKGSFNVYLGKFAAHDITEGDNNVFIGFEAGKGLPPNTYNTLVINSNKIGEPATKPLIYGNFISTGRMVVIDGDKLDNSGNFRFFVNGDAGGNSAWNNTSDRRLKKNIKTIPNALDRVLQLRGVNYEWKDTVNQEKGVRMGFIAQEAKDVIPEVVNGSEETQYSMQYAPITAILVEAIKKQQELIEDLQKRIEQLEAEGK